MMTNSNKKTIVVAALALVNKQGKILVARRGAQMKQAGLWEFPGGKIEAGESDQVCLRREWQEEFLVDVEVESHISTDIFDYGDFIVELRVWRGHLLSENLQLLEHDAIEWRSPEKLICKDLAPADIPAAKKLSELLKL